MNTLTLTLAQSLAALLLLTEVASASTVKITGNINPSTDTDTNGNMNGRYTIVGAGGKQGAAFNDDFASKGFESFDIYTPEIASKYAETFWTDMPNLTLPPSIVSRFKGKTIAIQGYEMDMVTHTLTPTNTHDTIIAYTHTHTQTSIM